MEALFWDTIKNFISACKCEDYESIRAYSNEMFKQKDKFSHPINVAILESLEKSCLDDNVILFSYIDNLAKEHNCEIDIYWNMYLAVINNKPNILKLLLTDSRFHYDYQLHEYLLEACIRGNVDIVKLLLNDSRLRINPLDHKSLKYACTGGHIEVVKLLIDLPEFSGWYEDSILPTVCARKHEEVALLLLTKAYVNPATKYNRALEHACREGLVKLTKKLLSDYRVTVSHSYLVYAIAGNQLEIVKLLLEDGRVNATTNDLEISKMYGHNSITKLLS